MSKAQRQGVVKYAGRAEGIIPVSFSLSREAHDFLRQIAPTHKAYGQTVSRLILEERARIELRLGMRDEISDVCSALAEYYTEHADYDTVGVG